MRIVTRRFPALAPGVLAAVSDDAAFAKYLRLRAVVPVDPDPMSGFNEL